MEFFGSDMQDLNDELDILGQQPSLGHLYTQLCFCFPVIDLSAHSSVISTLTKGIERISGSFPWLAGKVVNEDSDEANSGTFRIKPFKRVPHLVVKDLEHGHSIPTMDTLRRAEFPFSMLDEDIIAPCRTLSEHPNGSISDSEPVFLLQATFIPGGLLLTFVGQHQAMDMTGLGHMIYLFSKACHDLDFTDEEIAYGNLARRGLITLLDDSYKRGSELESQIVKTESIDIHQASIPPPKCIWAYYIFSPSSLAALKSIATDTITNASSYVSTDDALSAFIWKSITRARKARLTPTNESTFARAVNVRHCLDIPQTYPGLVQNMTYHTHLIQDLIEAPLGLVASQLRSALDYQKADHGYNTRALATFLDRTADKSVVSYTATLELSKDLALSSWATVDCHRHDFNLGLGFPESVRRPRFTPVEGLVYLMPRTTDGEIAVGICISHEDMVGLMADQEFTKYGRYIG